MLDAPPLKIRLERECSAHSGARITITSMGSVREFDLLKRVLHTVTFAEFRGCWIGEWWKPYHCHRLGAVFSLYAPRSSHQRSNRLRGTP